MAHKMTLLQAEAHNLRRANETLSKRRRAKKTCIQQGGTMTIEEAHDVLAQMGVEDQISLNIHENHSFSRERIPALRCCGKCGETGHNARTCRIYTPVS
jgi:hypothetical protein